MRIQIDFRDKRPSIETKATSYEVNHGCLILEHKDKGAIGYFPLDVIAAFLVFKNDNEGSKLKK